MSHRHILPVIGLIIALILPCIALAGSQQQSEHKAPASGATIVNPSLAPAAAISDWRTDIRQYAQRMINAGFIPGMQIAVTRGDTVVYVGSFGIADMNTGRRVNDQTRFYIASTTKALTATTVAVEASHGALQLDAPVTHYLPDLQFKAPLQADTVTIRDLLSMTDGIGDCFPVVFRTAFSGVFTPPGLVRLMQHCGPSKTGRAFSYRNLPYNILGIVLAPGTKNGWKAVVRKDVLKPLGMNETTARISTLDPAVIAMPHKATGGNFRRIRLGKTDANLHAAGGYFTTAHDLAKFVAVNATDGRLNGHRIFPAKVIAQTHAKHASQDRDFGPYHRFGWGFGWDLGAYEGHTIVHRFGAFAGYRSHASFMPDTGIGVVVLVNGVAVPFAVDEMADYIYDRLDNDHGQTSSRNEEAFRKLEQRKMDFAKRIAKHQEVVHARQQQALPHPLSAYTGRYVNPLMGAMNWTVSDGHLKVSMGVAQSNAEIYDATKNEFRVELIGSGQVIRFRFPKVSSPASIAQYGGYQFERIHAAK